MIGMIQDISTMHDVCMSQRRDYGLLRLRTADSPNVCGSDHDGASGPEGGGDA